MTRRDEQKEENRAKLVAAARKVFAEKGFGETTARAIVAETDLAVGTFYNYFSDKEAAFRAVLDEFSRHARAAAHERRAAEGASLEERVYGAYRAYFELAAANPELFVFRSRNAETVARLGGESVDDAAVSELVEDMRQWVEESQLPHAALEWLPEIARLIAGGGLNLAANLHAEGARDPDSLARLCTTLLLDGLRGLK
ncbi:MAG TPA: TetR/AcrR family transcriptional regulator [Gaiellaceae bacterium]